VASAWLASVLIDAIRDDGMLPTSEEASTDRLLGHLNRESRLWLTKLMLSAREDYLVESVTTPIVAGQSSYRIPSRAVGAKLKSVSYVGTDSLERPLNMIPEDQTYRNNVNGAGGEAYVEANSIVLTNAPAAGGSLKIKYYRRQNRVVAADETVEISALDMGLKTVTFTDPVPDDFGSVDYDFIQGTPHFEVLASDQDATLAGSVLTFASALPDDLAVGDYVALAGETPIVNVPAEMQDVLVLRAVYTYLLSIGDPKAGAVKDLLAEARADALSLITPRKESADEVLINYNAPGWNRFRRRYRGVR
jgi:hypothetical protein